MSIVICGDKSKLTEVTVLDNELLLPSMRGTFLWPEGPLSKEWEKLNSLDDIILVLTDGPSAAALALKVWPSLKKKITKIVYAGGALQKFDAPGFAEKSVYRDPYGVEALINSGIKVTFAVLDTASLIGTTMIELALNYARNPENYRIVECGAQVEYSKNSICYGKLFCDIDSDNKFSGRNCEIILFEEPQTALRPEV